MTTTEKKFAYLCYLVGYNDGMRNKKQADEEQLIDRVNEVIGSVRND